jgi:hypothetical protein
LVRTYAIAKQALLNPVWLPPTCGEGGGGGRSAKIYPSRSSPNVQRRAARALSHRRFKEKRPWGWIASGQSSKKPSGFRPKKENKTSANPTAFLHPGRTNHNARNSTVDQPPIIVYICIFTQDAVSYHLLMGAIAAIPDGRARTDPIL